MSKLPKNVLSLERVRIQLIIDWIDKYHRYISTCKIGTNFFSQISRKSEKPKVGGGAKTHLWSLLLTGRGGGGVAPPPSPTPVNMLYTVCSFKASEHAEGGGVFIDVSYWFICTFVYVTACGI